MFKSMMHGSIVFCVALWICSMSAFAVTIEEIATQIDAHLATVPGDTWSIQIQNMTGTITYYNQNAATVMRPASNTKLFTSSAAYGLLGPNHIMDKRGTTLHSYCKTMLKPSDNTMADNLLKHIGLDISGSSTYTAGAEDVISWCTAIGIDMTGAAMYDGSGLSYDNRFSAQQTISLLRYMENTYGVTYTDCLPIGCVDGTLASRFCDPIGQGNVVAKTGSLTNGQTVSLSGSIYNTYDGQKYLFSFYSNNATNVTATREAIDASVEVMGQSGIPNNVPTPTPTISPSPTPTLTPSPTPPVGIPAVPSNLTAAAVSKSQINLTWTDNSDNEENFIVERKTGSGGTYAVVATLGPNVTSYNNTGLSKNTTYYYRVKASNVNGSSGYSNEASATTPTH